MRSQDRISYRKSFATHEWHFEEDCPHWPRAQYVQYQAPSAPAQLCPECELRSRTYKVREASEFFLSEGKTLEAAAGQRIFSEREGGSKLPGAAGGAPVYFLLSGQVDLFVGGEKIASVAAGEVFGEAELIGGAPRCTSAVAAEPSRMVMLRPGEFHKALKKYPGFAFDLLSVLVSRVIKATAAVRANELHRDDCVVTGGNVLGRKLLHELIGQYEHAARLNVEANGVIFREGTVATAAYVVLEGRVDILVGDRLVETIGPGGIFGEMAVYGGGVRNATAIAGSDCTLLALPEKEFIALLRAKPEFVLRLARVLAERLRLMTASQQQH